MRCAVFLVRTSIFAARKKNNEAAGFRNPSIFRAPKIFLMNVEVSLPVEGCTIENLSKLLKKVDEFQICENADSRKTMPVDTVEIMNVLSSLAEEEQLKVTVKNAARGSVIAGLAAGAGGLLGGPLGMAIVGTFGVIIGAATSEKFLPVHQVIANMESSKKEILAEKVRRIMNNLDITDAMALTAMIACNADVKSKVLFALCSHLQTEMNQVIANY